MTERKDLPAAPAAKSEHRGPAAAPAPSQPVAFPRPAILPAAAGGFGHAMIRPAATQPAPAKPAAASAPVPGPAAPAVKPAETAAKPRAERTAAPKAAPRAKADIAQWLKGFDANLFWENYGKMTQFGALGALGTDGMRAGIEAGAILLRGMERLTQEMAAVAEEQMSSGAAAAAELGTCDSFPALVAAQASLARASYGRLAAAADRLSQMSVTLAEEVCEPIADGIDAAAGRFIRTLAR